MKQAISFLRNNNILLRHLEPEDVDLLYKWENDTLLWNVSNTLVPFSRYNLFEYIKSSSSDIYATKQIHLIIDTVQQPQKSIGSVELFDFDPFHLRVGLGIMIYDQENRRKHFASQALDLILDYCFNYLKVHNVYCNIAESNTQSFELFKSRKFEIIGQKKEWLNYGDSFQNEYMLQLINPYKL